MFSCDIGGDAITFIQEKFSVSFVEACRILTDEYGIHISYGRYSAKWNLSDYKLVYPKRIY